MKKNKKKVQKNKLTRLEITLICIIWGLILFGVFPLLLYTKGLSEEISKDYMVVNASNSEKERCLSLLDTALTNMEGSSFAISLQEGENVSTYVMFNSSSEIFAQDNEKGYLTVTLDNDLSISYQDSIYYGRNANTLKLLRAAWEMAKNKRAEVFKLNVTKGSEPSTDYIQLFIDVYGIDKIKELYELISPEIVDTMIDRIVQALQEANIQNVEDTVYRFYYAIHNSEDSSELAVTNATCYLYFNGLKPTRVKWSDAKINWMYSGLQFVSDWKLDTKWYELDWENLGNWSEDEVNVAEDLLDAQYNALTKILTLQLDEQEQVVGEIN